MLIITTSQKDPKVIDAILRQVLPTVDTPHRVEPFDPEDGLPEVEEGDVVLGMGGAVLDFLKASDEFPMVKKNTSLNSLRGTSLPYGDGRVMITYDPFMATVEPEKDPQLVWDVRLACRLHDTGDLKPPVGEYVWVDDFSELIARVEEISQETDKWIPLSPDLETLGLDPHFPGSAAVYDPEDGSLIEEARPAGRIITIFFSVDVGKSYGYRVPEDGKIPEHVHEQIEWLLTEPGIGSIGANLKYDIVWMAHHWNIWCTNQRADTMLIGSLLNENRSNSLNLHAKQHTDMGGYDDDFNDSNDKSRMDLALAKDPEGFKVYAGGDTDAALRTYKAMRPMLVKDKALTTFYTQLLQPAANVFAKVESRGVVVDRARYHELADEVQADLDKLHERCMSFVPKRLQNRYADKKDFLSSPPAMKDFLFTKDGLNLKPQMFTEKTKEPSATIEHLEMFSDNEAAAGFIEALSDYNGTKKTMSTYVTGFLKHLRADDRFHPSYMLHRGDYGDNDKTSGTVTGRTSAKDPAYQTIPKHTRWAKPLRTVYTCPPGMVILKADFSQGELRVTACVADEQNMIKTYKKGIDLHLRTGALINNITLEEALALQKAAVKGSKEEKFIKMVRQGGKAGNFGLIYGMGEGGFQDFARKTYGVILTDQQTRTFRNAFFAEYHGLPAWHDEYKLKAKRFGFVRSPLGRIRHLPLINSKKSDLRAGAERMSINSPIQSCLSDMMMLGMVMLDRAYPDLWIFGMTHDDVGMYVPEGEVDMWAKRVQDVLQDLPLHKFGFYPKLDFVADIEVSSTNLAECDPYKWPEAA